MSKITLSFDDDNERLSNLCGNLDEHLRLIEKRTMVDINNRGALFQIVGNHTDIENARAILEELYRQTDEKWLEPNDVHLVIQELGPEFQEVEQTVQDRVIKTKAGLIRGRTPAQKAYLYNMGQNDINFGIGPAGTGKTFLAVAAAVEALQKDEARRIILVRPAVEAGEKLGFLPGDLTEKIDPYLRPLYDALYEMLGFETVNKLIERHTIEIAPLAFMRGRTLNDAYIILDEAQNTTIEQMKMFLTRIGFGSTAVITGDASQVDLPRHVKSGLKHALEILNNVEGISISHFSSADVVRHPMVAKIIDAYEKADEAERVAKEKREEARRAERESVQ
ncbi:phosphate starvation-inducible protein PhoH [Ignatzschineria ureiclastica]|uniref:PhoH-like protein n=1 Tax=Ignatzschineria ureiclastica TaxID=472582 RepID=A0A2U2AGC9_9GAMM|nr:PhoH family protein [Ignatzschineria ureiclastica]PWD81711.1 phosphate starvation-inducible protein PhoH [Ignatzschineria ureiclastica]GGZ90067.1 ATP-binding protein [Ignatzschineria ureiclastica]